MKNCLRVLNLMDMMILLKTNNEIKTTWNFEIKTE